MTNKLTPKQLHQLEIALEPCQSSLSALEVQRLIKALGLSLNALMQALLPFIAKRATCPISNFSVGAIGLGHSGNLYFGANLEFENLPLNNCIHGEQALLASAWLAGEQSIGQISVNAAPCGHCRQFMREFNQGDSLSISWPDQENIPLQQILPASFGPQQLGVKTSPFDAAPNRLDLIDVAQPSTLLQLTLDQANASYAPYSSQYAAVVIECKTGHTYIGRYCENAAFNPSLLPMQMALSQMALHGVEFAQINRALLVSCKDDRLGHHRNAAEALASVSHKPLEYHPAILRL